MNQLIKADVKMTSLDIAEVTGKEHKNIMRDVRNEIKELGEDEGLLIFELTERVDSHNRRQPVFTFGKEGAMQLALKYDAKTRRSVIKYVEQLENKPKSPLEIMQMAVSELTTHDKRITNLEENMRIDGVQEFQIRKRANQVVVKSLGGKKKPAYKQMSNKVFARFWRDFKDHFMIPRYGELPKLKFDEGIDFINIWQPDTSTRLEIDSINRQMTIGGGV